MGATVKGADILQHERAASYRVQKTRRPAGVPNARHGGLDQTALELLGAQARADKSDEWGLWVPARHMQCARQRRLANPVSPSMSTDASESAKARTLENRRCMLGQSERKLPKLCSSSGNGGLMRVSSMG